MNIDNLSENAIAVLVAVASQTPDPKGFSAVEVKNDSGLSGLDFNLALRELEEFKIDDYPVVFQASNGNLKMNPGGWKLVEENKDRLRSTLEG